MADEVKLLEDKALANAVEEFVKEALNFRSWMSASAIRGETFQADFRPAERAAKLFRLKLQDDDPNIREVGLIGLGGFGATVLSDVAGCLTDKNLEVRLRAVEALGDIGVPALAELEEMLDDGEEKVILGVIGALGKIGAPALPLLEKALGNEAESVRSEVAHKLGTIGAPALGLLEMALRDSEITVRKRAVRALRDVGEAAAPSLEQALADEDVEVRGEAVQVLGRFVEESEVAVPNLVVALEDSSRQITNVTLSWLARDGLYGSNEYQAPAETIADSVIERLIIRADGRDAKYFDPALTVSGLELAIEHSPSLKGKILERLCKLAFEAETGVRDRAVRVGRELDRAEMAHIVRQRAAANPKLAAQVMAMLGGEEATAFFTQRQTETMAEYRASLLNLREETQKHFEEMTEDAHRGATISRWMSVGVFVIGTIVLVVAVILLAVSNDWRTQLVAVLAALGSFIGLYAQRFWKEPVEQIQKFTSQQACLRVAFIGYMYRTSQLQFIFENQYGPGKTMEFEEAERYQAMFKDATDQAWRQLSEAAADTEDRKGNGDRESAR